MLLSLVAARTSNRDDTNEQCCKGVIDLIERHSNFVRQVGQVYLFYNQKIIDPCGTYIQSQVNTGINIGIIYN